METTPSTSSDHTPFEVIANVSRVVTKVVDRLTSDRSDYPLLVSAVCKEALAQHGIESRVMYGQAAWIEVLQNHSVIWAGCWGKHTYPWVATQFGEVVDLNVSVAHRKKSHQDPESETLYAPPMIWSKELPKFYRYVPEGIAEVEPDTERDRRWLTLATEEVREKCSAKALAENPDQEFPNEPMICPNRKLLDDTHQTFQLFDRALSVQGIPDSPF